jgi:lysophospholipase L1-like esterase
MSAAPWRTCCSIFMALALSSICANAEVRSGPTPYPTSSAKWPGRGAIRVFDWMMEYRKRFWLEQDRYRNSIVFAGDSLTANWRSLAEDFPQAKLANRGIGGEVSRGLLFRFDEDVLALRPKAIVMLIGTNDLTARQAAADTLWNIELILQMRAARQPEVPVLLCTVPPSAAPRAPVDEQQRRRLNDGLRELAAKHAGIELVDLFQALATADDAVDPRFFQPDRLHLSKLGYSRWREVLRPALVAVGAITAEGDQ